ncbi:hypothetical protein I6A60_31250 [Frankia sp. AgB1.9]|nr:MULTISPECIES: hypothetical protein [unclassified Frankia]MBL7493894.1 hypothetical protein [Frankia sp. AgW1.1]MBL7552307.1 hypothetical protein [Frankia sp. AgB1.9]MBL7622060.1 hypothetical protein [Frankia sp. AgB1.8]
MPEPSRGVEPDDDEPVREWDFTSVVSADDFAPAAQRHRARLDPDALRALDRWAGQ